MSTIDEQAYSVTECEGKFELRSNTGRCLMVCTDSHSAEHYAGLLNEAFVAGYRQGRREQRMNEV